MANSKRGATSDLNHNNWDQEDEPEDSGSFKTASEDILKNRVIKVAKRRNPLGSVAPSTSDSDPEKKNIFANFGGFGTMSATTSFNFLSKVSTSTELPKTNGLGLTNTTTTLVDSSNHKSKEYYAKIKGLNQSVSNWIKKHVDTNPFLNLTPIFRDYEKYFQEIESLATTKLDSKSTSPNKILPFSNVKETESSMFSFGKTPSSTNLSSAGFSFGTAVNQPLTFTNSAKPVEIPDNKEETESDEPPKVDFTPVVEEGHVYTVRCKVFVKKGESYSDRGVGTLYLKPIPDSDKVQLIVRADTSLGLLLCNFILSNNIPMQRMGKKDVMLMCLPLPENNPPPVPVLLRVKSPDQADELLTTLEKHKNHSYKK